MVAAPLGHPTTEPEWICFVCRGHECEPCEDCGHNGCQCDCACECGRGPRHTDDVTRHRSTYCRECLREDAADFAHDCWRDDR